MTVERISDQAKKVITLLASAQYEATGATNSSEFNAPWAKGIKLFIDVSADTGSGTIVVKLQDKDPLSGNWVDIAGATTATLTGTGTVTVTMYPGIAETANVSVSDILGDDFRIVWTMGGTSVDMTGSVSAVLLP